MSMIYEYMFKLNKILKTKLLCLHVILLYIEVTLKTLKTHTKIFFLLLIQFLSNLRQDEKV